MALIPESLSNTALYGWHNNLPLPLESLVEDFKVTVVNQWYCSTTIKASGDWQEVDCREGCPASRVQTAQEQVDVVLRQGWSRLCPNSPCQYLQREGKVPASPGGSVSSSGGKEGLVRMRQQEAWSRWENALKRRVMWVALWRAAPQWIKFLRGSSLSTRDWGAASKSINGGLSVSWLRLAAGGLQPGLYPEPSSAGSLK